MPDAGDDISAAILRDGKQALADLVRSLDGGGRSSASGIRRRIEDRVHERREERASEGPREGDGSDEPEEGRMPDAGEPGDEVPCELVYLEPEDEEAFLAMLDEAEVEHLPAESLDWIDPPLVEGARCHVLPDREPSAAFHAPFSRVDHAAARSSTGHVRLAEAIRRSPELAELIELQSMAEVTARRDLAAASAGLAPAPAGRGAVRLQVRTLPFDRDCRYFRNLLKGAGIAAACSVAGGVATFEVDAAQAPAALALVESQMSVANMGPERFANLEEFRSAACPECLAAPGELMPVLSLATPEAAAFAKEALAQCGVSYEAHAEEGVEYVKLTEPDWRERLAESDLASLLRDEERSRELARDAAARLDASRGGSIAGEATCAREAARKARGEGRAPYTPSVDRVEGRRMASAHETLAPERSKVVNR